MDKVVATDAEAVADVPDGASLAVGGFGLSGVPNVLIQALYERGMRVTPARGAKSLATVVEPY